MKRKLAIFAAALICAYASAQNLNPTVEVTGTYAGTASDISKPSETMAVPDTVLKFDMVYDYEARPTDYKGAYDFRPYKIDLRPDPRPYDGKRLFLRAGAGFRFHPEADLVVTPFDREKFNLNVYGHHRSYIGPYVTPDEVFDGKDLWTKAGADGIVRWDDGNLGFNVNYGNLATRDNVLQRCLNTVEADLHLKSVELPQNQFYYDVLVNYRYGIDNFKGTGDKLRFHHFKFDSELGPVLGTDHKVLADVDMDLQDFGYYFDSYVGTLGFAPHYIFSHGPWNLRLGARLSVRIGDDVTEREGHSKMHGNGVQLLSPDVFISFNPWDGAVVFYTEAKGGNSINAYDDILTKNHFFNPYYNIAGGNVLLDNSITRIYASLGFKGNISSRFHYDLCASYSFKSNSLEQGVVVRDGVYLPAISYGTYHLLMVNLDYGWKSRSFSADGRFTYSRGFLVEPVEGLLPPASFTGNLNAVYNYRGRVWAGVNMDFSTERQASLAEDETYTLPGFFDLGLNAGYNFTPWLGVWLKSGNLLFQKIWRTPFYAEKGAYVTVGATLSF